MSNTISLAIGKWHKFSRYERRGVCIVPGKDAKLRTYDPWALEERPYTALQDIVRASPDPLDRPASQPKVVQAALSWCNRYGLLGTLLHRTVSATTAARWTRREHSNRKKRPVFVPKQHTFAQIPGGWVTQARWYDSVESNDPTVQGKPVEKEADPKASLSSPTAMLVDLPGVETSASIFKTGPLEETWGPYFPGVQDPKTYDYPAPLSPEFWSIYGEPLYEIVEIADLMTNALEAIRKPRHSKAAAWAFEELSFLASQTSPMFERQRDGTLRQRWQTGSLLSSLALMAMEDIAAGRLHRCDTCQHLFLSTAYHVAYCSARCRNTKQKQRFRARHPTYERTARRQRAERDQG